MIWQAWAVLVLVGSGAAYLAFVAKRAPVFTSLATIGCFSVASLGALNLQIYEGGQEFSETEAGIAILCAMTAVVGGIVFLAAATGQYGDPDPEDDPTGGAGVTPETEKGALDRAVSKMR